MLNAVQIVLTLLIMMAVGYYLTAKGLITAKVAKFLSQLVLWVGVPASSMDNMLGSFSADMLKGAGLAILAPFVSNFIGFLMAVLVARLIRVRKGRRGIFYLMFAFSNTIFIVRHYLATAQFPMRCFTIWEIPHWYGRSGFILFKKIIRKRKIRNFHWPVH